ncbi:hypothetical protein FF1_023398 [Malus domestica]
MDAPPTLPISNSQTTVGAQSQPPIATSVHASISRHGFSQCRLWYELVDRSTLARPDSRITAYSRSTLARPDSRIESSAEVDLEEVKINVAKVVRDCKIYHLSLDATNHESGIPIELGCSCKADLAAAHKQCAAEAWFKIKGNNASAF